MLQKPLPPNWSWVKLGDVSQDIRYGYTASSTAEPNGPKFLRITDIQDGRVEWNKVPYCKIEEDEATKYLLHENDIVFARTGATVGKSFLLNGQVPKSVFASYLIRLQVSENVLPIYVYLFFQSNKYWVQIKESSAGIGQPNVNATKLKNLQFPLPPLNDQHRIVEKIEELFSELDNGIENLKKAKAQIKTYRQAVLKSAFEGKLVQGKGQEAKGKSKNGELPEGWEWTKLGELSEVITKGSSPRWQGFEYLNDTKQTLFITSENVRENSLDLSKSKYLDDSFNKKQKRSILQKGDVLFNLVGASIGRAAVFNIEVKSNINQAVALIRLGPKLLNKYLSYFLNSENAKQKYMNEIVDVARANLSLTDTSNIEIPLCSIDQQTHIVEEIEKRFSVTEKMEAAIDESLKKSEALRQSILKQAFEGKLV